LPTGHDITKKKKIMIAYITELNAENFEEFTKNELTLVDIWAPWCGPCKMISPIVDEISSKYQGKLSVGKLNADDNSDIVRELGVRNIPTLLLYRNGELIKDSEGNVEKLVGSVDRAKLEAFVEKHIQ
jgi:thioredoxin 1